MGSKKWKSDGFSQIPYHNHWLVDDRSVILLLDRYCGKNYECEKDKQNKLIEQYWQIKKKLNNIYFVSFNLSF